MTPAAAIPIAYIEIAEQDVSIGHEASVSRIGEEAVVLSDESRIIRSGSEHMIVNGFIEPLVKELPMEYAVELNRFDPASNGRLGGLRGFEHAAAGGLSAALVRFYRAAK